VRWKAPQTFAKTFETLQSTCLGVLIQSLVGGKPGGKPHHFAQTIQRINLLSYYSRYLQTKAVGAEVYRRESGIFEHEFSAI
jgi:hypothetical protein